MLTAVIVAAAVLAAAVIVNALVNRRVRLVRYDEKSPRLPAAFDGFRILVVSDLHNAPFAEQILALAEREKPDVVVFPGDMAYGPRPETMAETCRIVEGLGGRIPAYAVSGNHESCLKYGQFEKIFTHAGGIWLDDACETIRRGGEAIRLVGVRDRLKERDAEARCSERLRENLDPDTYSVTLCHRPEVYPSIADSGTDLVLSGHHHGGLLRLPVVGGVFSHRGKLFPKYDRGRYDGGRAPLIVSAGCDDGSRLPRFNNPPEVLLVTLKRKKEEP